MIEIYLKNGVYYELDTTVEYVRSLLEDEFIKEDTFLPFLYEDGSKAYIKKSEIVAFNETD